MKPPKADQGRAPEAEGPPEGEQASWAEGEDRARDAGEGPHAGAEGGHAARAEGEGARASRRQPHPEAANGRAKATPARPRATRRPRAGRGDGRRRGAGGALERRRDRALPGGQRLDEREQLERLEQHREVGRRLGRLAAADHAHALGHRRAALTGHPAAVQRQRRDQQAVVDRRGQLGEVRGTAAHEHEVLGERAADPAGRLRVAGAEPGEPVGDAVLDQRHRLARRPLGVVGARQRRREARRLRQVDRRSGDARAEPVRQGRHRDRRTTAPSAAAPPPPPTAPARPRTRRARRASRRPRPAAHPPARPARPRRARPAARPSRSAPASVPARRAAARAGHRSCAPRTPARPSSTRSPSARRRRASGPIRRAPLPPRPGRPTPRAGRSPHAGGPEPAPAAGSAPAGRVLPAARRPRPRARAPCVVDVGRDRGPDAAVAHAPRPRPTPPPW